MDNLAKTWILPIMQGFIDTKSVTLDGGTEIKLTLISRRSVYRAGVRYIKRGVNVDGNVANFVETEQILTVFGHTLAFVQVPGIFAPFASYP